MTSARQAGLRAEAPRPVLPALAWGLIFCAALCACESDHEPPPAAPVLALMPSQQDAVAVAPTTRSERTGVWLGGPEPVSGKLRTGIAVYYRPFSPVPGKPFDLALRFEGVNGEDAAVQLRTSDGARLILEGGSSYWRLTAGVPSQLTVKLSAPPGDSYLNIFTSQNGRHAANSIALSVPSDAPLRPAGYRAGDDKDANGAPIVRMQAGPNK